MEYITARKLPLQDKINVRTKKAGGGKRRERERNTIIYRNRRRLTPTGISWQKAKDKTKKIMGKKEALHETGRYQGKICSGTHSDS